MSLTVIVTRDVEARYRGFLASLMLEIAPGVYVSPSMTRRVREHTWSIMQAWHAVLQRGSITLVWQTNMESSKIGLCQLGEPPRELVDVDGLLLVRRALSRQ